MDFGSLLSQFASADNQQRQAAESQLANCMNDNFPQFVMGMMEVLVNRSMDSSIRQMAGIVFKRAISTLSGDMLLDKRVIWSNLGENIRNQVKEATLQCLNDPAPSVRNAAASALSAIARIEVPVGMWDTLFDQLGTIMLDSSVAEQSKCSCLETLRYICEDLTVDSINITMSSSIMMTILYSLQTTMPSSIRQQGIQALNAALDYADQFMQSPEQCTRVMEGVLSCCQDADEDVQLHAIICLNGVFECFYEKLDPYIQTFYLVCKGKIENYTDPKVAIQAAFALETLAQTELSLTPDQPCLNLVRRIGEELVAVLCTAMTKQDEDDDGETMTVSIAAATCLASYCEVLGNDVVNIVWPFVNSNITSTDWHLQEAAIMTFGCLLNGPQPEYIATLVAQAVTILPEIMFNSPSIAVRDSASWAISQICDSHLTSVPGEYTQQLIQAVINALNSEPRVSQHAALAISYICDFISKPGVQTNLLSSYYNDLLSKLMDCSQRDGAANNQLRENAAYALISLIACGAQDCEAMLVSFTQFVIDRFNECTKMINYPEMIDTVYNMQRFYCIVLVTLAQRMGSQLREFVNTMNEISIYVLNSQNTAAHTQGILLYNNLVDIAPDLALIHLESELPFILKGITTPEDVPTCRSAICCFGCILHTIGSSDVLTEGQKTIMLQPIITHIHTIINSTLNALRSDEISRDIKPNLFTCLSDILWELSPYIVQHVNDIVEISVNAAHVCNLEENSNEEDLEWMDMLISSVIDVWDACSELDVNSMSILINLLPEILYFVGGLVTWAHLTPQLMHSCLIMIQDLGRNVDSGTAKRILNHQAVNALFSRASTASDEFYMEVKEVQETLNSTYYHQYSSW